MSAWKIMEIFFYTRISLKNIFESFKTFFVQYIKKNVIFDALWKTRDFICKMAKNLNKRWWADDDKENLIKLAVIKINLNVIAKISPLQYINK